MTKKRRRGQPTKYKKEYCEVLIKHLSSGLDLQACAGEMDINQDTLFEWFKQHKEFSEAKKRGLAKAAAMYQKLGMNAMVGGIKNFQNPIWIFTMKNRFGWRDKVEMVDETDYDGFELDES